MFLMPSTNGIHRFRDKFKDKVQVELIRLFALCAKECKREKKEMK